MTLPQYLENLDTGTYAPCTQELEKKLEKPNGDRIRDNYELGMIKHFQKDYDSSLKIMGETDMLMEDAVTQSITKGFAAAVGNDNADEYKGTPYEYVYINIFNALNYYSKGDIDEAAVEVRRLNEKQRKYLNDYGEWLKNDDSQIEISDTYKKLKLNSDQIYASVPEKPTEADIFRDSATARYLSIIFGMMDESVNNSWNVESDSRTLNALNPAFDVLSISKIAPDYGRLDVLSFAGLIGRRGERRLVVGPFPGIQFPVGKTFVYIPGFDLEFVWPEFPAPQTVLKPQVIPTLGYGPSFTIYPGKNEILPNPKNQIAAIKIIFEKGDTLPSQEVSLSLLEDFNYAVQKDVHSKARKAYSRSIKRSMVKKFTAVAGATATLLVAEQALSRQENLLTIAAYAGTYLSAAKAVDQVDRTETADIRQVYALPAQSYAGGIELKPGVYSFKVVYYSNEGNVLYEEHFKNIEIKQGRTTLVESTCQK